MQHEIDDYVRLRLAVAKDLMTDMSASMADDRNYWERTGIKPGAFLTALVRICEDDRVFAQAKPDTEHIREFMTEFTRFNEADGSRRYVQWGLPA